VDKDLKALFQTLIEGQILTGKNVGDLVTAMHSHLDASGARAARVADGLIRAITREHTNGKAH
jgi:hypothetical protein